MKIIISEYVNRQTLDTCFLSLDGSLGNPFSGMRRAEGNQIDFTKLLI